MTVQNEATSKEDKSPLKFNPISDEYKVLNNGYPIYLTPSDANYILMHHNGDNRPKKKAQVSKIRKGIENKFRKDGQPITFNTNGDLTEKQHTLDAVSQMPSDKKFPFFVTVGVEPDCFTTTVPAKNRTPLDEVQRQDPSCIATEYSTLAAILARQGDKPHTQTIVRNWELWKVKIRASIRSCDDFWNDTNGQVFTQIKSTVHAFTAICHVDYKEGQARMILDQVSDHINPDEPSTPLAESLYNFFRDNTGDGDYGHNKKKELFLFRSLCTALDRLMENEFGDLELGLTVDNLADVDNTETYKKYIKINPLSRK